MFTSDECPSSGSGNSSGSSAQNSAKEAGETVGIVFGVLIQLCVLSLLIVYCRRSYRNETELVGVSFRSGSNNRNNNNSMHSRNISSGRGAVTSCGSDDGMLANKSDCMPAQGIKTTNPDDSGQDELRLPNNGQTKGGHNKNGIGIC